ncbi:hypothetical protein Hypma_008741 [Hypsizygus marmoreus]|uniref:Uncharacterized protein n=1 Tax=Hypsizygus marmoreus TaxID=39966 RepID=A0A369JV58_HYPMA|nr:hypothetical protein Hypma_008741 [Hypsizygus marmoreus]
MSQREPNKTEPERKDFKKRVFVRHSLLVAGNGSHQRLRFLLSYPGTPLSSFFSAHELDPQVSTSLVCFPFSDVRSLRFGLLAIPSPAKLWFRLSSVSLQARPPPSTHSLRFKPAAYI